MVRAQFGFGTPFAFSGGLDVPLQAQRDSRQDRGPVLFPQAPPDNGESSGVVVGASGYGFVPPNNQGLKAFCIEITTLLKKIVHYQRDAHVTCFALNRK